jgi:xanthine dehydrogenase YagT iron-sulfur-binding subunit
MPDTPFPDDPSESSNANVSRRAFLSTAGTAGVAAAIAGGCEMNNKASSKSAKAVAAPATSPATASPAPAGAVPITLRVNGIERQVHVDPRATLLDTLRESLDLTGTKKGCDHGQCGACTVHVNGRRVNSCLTLALTVQGDDITTIEGIGAPESLHPMQAAFVACDGYQCGYCTSGQIMSAVALLKEPCGPADADVKELMSGNICRCGAYPNIVAAIQQVRHNA